MFHFYVVDIKKLVHTNLAQIEGTLHNICRDWGSKPKYIKLTHIKRWISCY